MLVFFVFYLGICTGRIGGNLRKEVTGMGGWVTRLDLAVLPLWDMKALGMGAVSPLGSAMRGGA